MGNRSIPVSSGPGDLFMFMFFNANNILLSVIINSSIIVIVFSTLHSRYSWYFPWFFGCKYASKVGCKHICFFPIICCNLGFTGSTFNFPIPGLIVVLDLKYCQKAFLFD